MNLIAARGAGQGGHQEQFGALQSPLQQPAVLHRPIENLDVP